MPRDGVMSFEEKVIARAILLHSREILRVVRDRYTHAITPEELARRLDAIHERAHVEEEQIQRNPPHGRVPEPLGEAEPCISCGEPTYLENCDCQEPRSREDALADEGDELADREREAARLGRPA